MLLYQAEKYQKGVVSILKANIFLNKVHIQGLSVGVMQVSSKLLLLLLGIVLGRALGTEGYGIYAYAMAILSFLAVVAGAGIPTLLLREVAINVKQEKWSQVMSILRKGYLTVGGTTLCVAAVGAWLIYLMQSEFSPVALVTNMAMLILLPFVVYNSVQGHVLRGLGSPQYGVMLESIVRPLIVIVVAWILFAAVPVSRSPAYAMVVQAAVGSVVVLIGFYFVRRELPVKVSRVPLRGNAGSPWLRSTIPFTMISLAWVVHGQADIITLGWLRTHHEVGVYRVAVQASVLVALSLQIANTVVAPRIAAMNAAGEHHRLQRLVTGSARVVLLLALPVVVVYIFLGDKIVGFLFGEPFKECYVPLVILSFGHLVNAFFGPVGVLLNMTGFETDMAKYLWLSALLNVVLNVLLVPAYGMNGAAVATGISVIVWNVLLFIKVQRQLGINTTAFASIRASLQ